VTAHARARLLQAKNQVEAASWVVPAACFLETTEPMRADSPRKYGVETTINPGEA
jgi:hypothetical protein